MASEIKEHKLEAHLAEYRALRKEIEVLMRNENLYLNFSLTIIVAAIALTRFLTSSDYNAMLFFGLLLLPIPIFIFAYLYMRQHEAIFVVASYIKFGIRPNIIELCSGDRNLWNWEDYKDDFIKRIKIPHRMVFRIKILFFAFMMFLSMCFAISYVHFSGEKLLSNTHGNYNFLIILLITLNIALLIKLLYDMINVPSRLFKAFEIKSLKQ
jgi:hypothetical protein